MKISKYKGLYTLEETKNGITKIIASSWERSDLEGIKAELEK